MCTAQHSTHIEFPKYQIQNSFESIEEAYVYMCVCVWLSTVSALVHVQHGMQYKIISVPAILTKACTNQLECQQYFNRYFNQSKINITK